MNEWERVNKYYYKKMVGKFELCCIRHKICNDYWWDISYSDSYINLYDEIDESEIDINNPEEVLKYADEWLKGVIENIKYYYENLEV